MFSFAQPSSLRFCIRAHSAPVKSEEDGCQRNLGRRSKGAAFSWNTQSVDFLAYIDGGDAYLIRGIFEMYFRDLV